MSYTLISLLSNVLRYDSDKVLIRIAQNSLTSFPSLGNRAPLHLLLKHLLDIFALHESNQCQPDHPWTVEQMESTLLQTITFLRDEEQGLGGIYRLLKLREMSDAEMN